MLRLHTVTRAFLALALSAGPAPASPPQDAASSGSNSRPNVVLVMADDLGIGDVSPTNPACKIPTPHLAKLAAEGMTFLDAHSTSAVCTPTRYALMTGRYNWRSRLEKGVLGGWSDHLIPADRPTVAHMMRAQGYATAMVGKWHLGWDWARNGETQKDVDFTKPVLNGPDINGFDRYFAHNGSLDMPPYVWVDTGGVTAVPDRVEGVARKDDRYGWYRKGPIGSDFHIDEVLPLLFGKAVSYVEERAEAAQGGDPFFLYLALPAPHTPIVPVPPFKDASGLNSYADFVMQVDHHMGELLAAIEAGGIEGETLVVFTSDNGCSSCCATPGTIPAPASAATRPTSTRAGTASRSSSAGRAAFRRARRRARSRASPTSTRRCTTSRAPRRPPSAARTGIAGSRSSKARRRAAARRS